MLLSLNRKNCHSAFENNPRQKKLNKQAGAIIIMPQLVQNQMVMQELVRRTNEEARRIRDAEERILSLEEKINALEENYIAKMRKMSSRFTDMEATMKNLGDEIALLKNGLERIGKQMETVARKKDLRELEKMFDLLSPMKKLEDEIEVKTS
jgi:flagellar capping protein FliD